MQELYWVTVCSLVGQLDAIWNPTMKVSIALLLWYHGDNFYIPPLPPMCAIRALWGVCHSLRPAQIRIFDDWKHIDKYMPSVGCLIAACASLLEDVRWSKCMNRTLLVGLIVSGIALGIEVDMALTSHFLKKWHFLSMSLPDPVLAFWKDK